MHLWPFSSLDNKLAPNKKSFGSFLDVGAAWLLSIQGWHADLVIYYKDMHSIGTELTLQFWARQHHECNSLTYY